MRSEKREGEIRVAVLTNTVPEYRRPVLERVSEEPGVKLEVFVSLPEGVADPRARESLTLRHPKGVNLRRRMRHHGTGTEQVEWLHIPLMLIVDLLRFRPSVIISGEFGLRSLIALLAARLLGSRFVLWSEEIKENAAAASGLRRHLRRLLIGSADAFLAWGRPAENYLRMWGVPNHKIHYCAQAVDNGFWLGQSRRCQRDVFRQANQLRGKVFIAVGRLMPRKGFDKLIVAWEAMGSQAKQQNTLVIVGGGEHEAHLRDMVSSRGIPNVLFAGPQPPDQLGMWYGAADVFVFPSLVDVWGLVVNEAMACGLPVLASRHAGASQELVANNGVGELFDPLDTGEFAVLLERWCSNDHGVDREQIYKVVERLNFDVSAAAISRLISRADTSAWCYR